MTSQAPSHGLSLTRYRPAIVVFAALAVGCSIYYVHSAVSASNTEEAKNQKGNLHRSNAVRRARPPRPINTDAAPAQPEDDDVCPISPAFLGNMYYYGDYIGTSSTGARLEIPMVHGDLPSPSSIMERHNLPYIDAAQVREHLEVAFLDAFFARTMPSGPIVHVSERSCNYIIERLGTIGNYQPRHIIASLERYVSGELEDHPNRVERQQHADEDVSSAASDDDEDEDEEEEEEVEEEAEEQEATEGQPSTDQSEDQPGTPAITTNPEPNIERPLPTRQETDNARTEHSIYGESENDRNKQGQSLLRLVYTIAEEQAKKEGYVHRGVSCNSCGATPIRGIRYRCANCVDFDLCEQCEALQMHPRTHLFYKVRIPAPFLGNPRQPQPVWYPGKPSSIMQPLSREHKSSLCQRSGFQLAQVEALWEQFLCLAATYWPQDPIHYSVAIDRRTFDKCFITTSTSRLSPPNLIYDRIFSFYDSNDDGLIGFEEFLLGTACTQLKDNHHKLRRIFDGFDMDRDGFVDRKDFLRMFKALFHLHQELAKDIVVRLNDDDYDEDDARHVIQSSQAISAAFPGIIEYTGGSQAGQGKTRDKFGDDVVKDPSNQGNRKDRAYDEGVKYVQSIYVGEPEEDHGQEVLFHVIHDAINELLDQIFKFREDLALEVIRTSEGRRKYPEEMARLVNAGFLRQMTPLLLRSESKLRTSPGNTSDQKPSEAARLLIHLKQSEEFGNFDPSNGAAYIPSVDEPLSTPTPSSRTRLSTPGTMTPETPFGGQHDNADFPLRTRARNWPPGQEPVERQEGSLERLAHDFADVPCGDLEGADSAGPAQRAWDAAWTAEPPPVSRIPSLYEYSFFEGIPTDPTLPQNRANNTEQPVRNATVIIEDGDDGPASLGSSSPPSVSNDPEDQIRALLDRYSPSKPAEKNSASAEIETKKKRAANVPRGSMSKMRPHTPPPLPRLKELALGLLIKEREELRGGWGRISWEEFEEIMKGPKGPSLGFVGNWLDVANY